MPVPNDELPKVRRRPHHHDHRAEVYPGEGGRIELSGGGSFKARLIDCVGYMVDGASAMRKRTPRLVKSPWFDHEVPA